MPNFEDGTVTGIVHGQLTAGDVDQTLLAANGDRDWLIFQNLGPRTAYFTFGVTATTALGFQVLAGGVYETDSKAITAGVHIITAAAGSADIRFASGD